MRRPSAIRDAGASLRDGAAERSVGASPLVGLENILSSLQEAARVLGAAIDPDLVMQVRPGGPAGGAHRGDPVSNADALAGTNGDRGEVGVTGLQATAVVDLDD